ncbi:MAG: replication endonuclease, partial [Methylobacillus glycogenes]|nr:replication endonuclease [Methylobacillus glycogenes]
MMLAIEVTSERLDHLHIRSHFAKFPKRFKPAINRRYVEIYQTQGRAAANLSLIGLAETLGGRNSHVAASDEELCDLAKGLADKCASLCEMWLDADAAMNAMLKLAGEYGVFPEFKGKTGQGSRARLLCPLWWRRQLRKTVARRVEAAAIGLGLVSKRT